MSSAKTTKTKILAAHIPVFQRFELSCRREKAQISGTPESVQREMFMFVFFLLGKIDSPPDAMEEGGEEGKMRRRRRNRGDTLYKETRKAKFSLHIFHCSRDSSSLAAGTELKSLEHRSLYSEHFVFVFF